MTATPGQPAQPDPAPSASSSGFFKALFDFNFNHFVTPTIVKVVYIVGLVIIGLITLVLFFTAFRQFSGDFGTSPILGLLQLIGAPLLGIFYLAFFRMSLELYYAIIRMSEDVHHGRGRV